MDYPELKNTVFGEVFAEMLEARDLPVTPFKIGKLAEEAGLNGWAFIDRMASADSRTLAHLNLRLAEKLDLSEPEKASLAFAFVFERRTEDAEADVIANILSTVNGNLGAAIDGLESLPVGGPFGAEAVREAHQAVAQAGGIVCREQRRVSEGVRPE